MASTNFIETKRLIESHQTRDEAAEVAREMSDALKAEETERVQQQPHIGQDEMQAFQRADVATPIAHRSLLDKFVDYILNDGPNNRFALICRRCHSHNGLVMKEDIGVVYLCRVCGARNGGDPDAEGTCVESETNPVAVADSSNDNTSMASEPGAEFGLTHRRQAHSTASPSP